MIGIKQRKKTLALAARPVRIEGLESRRLLAGVQAGSFLYFVNTDADHGSELWKSDLDGSNQTLVKDIRPGIYGSDPSELFDFNGILFFSAINGSPGIGRELYKSDGTEAGTQLVKDIYPGGSGSYPNDFRIIDGHFVFLASQSGTLRQIYTTDGTTEGTIRLFSETYHDIAPQHLYVGNDGLLYFDAHNDSLNIYEHWRTDGTPEGTLAIEPIGSIVNGVLTIIGSEVNDQIHVTTDGTITRFTVNGLLQSAAADVTSIFIDAGDGDDVIRLDGLLIPTRTYLRDGNDTFFGGEGADRVYGGDGNDWIGGFGGNDILYGEDGNDRIFGGAGRDYIDGGAGNDVMRGESDVDRIFAKSGDDFRGNPGDLITLVT